MLSKDMPRCLCTKQDWRPGGAQFGNGSFQWFTCSRRECGRIALDVYFGTGVLLMTRRDQPGEFSKEELGYVNGPLMAALNFRQMRVEKAREVVAERFWDSACDSLGIPKGTMFDRVPVTLQAKFRMLSDYTKEPTWLVPPGFGEPFIPPQVPESLAAFTHRKHRRNRWREVSREQSAAIAVPRHPIRIRHDEYFQEVFQALAPLADITPLETLNEYCGSTLEPWYQFDVNRVMFTVGPRKRVVNIRVLFPPTGPAPDLSAIRLVAQRDEVTFEMGLRGGTIHAWNKFRLVEYLTILITAAKNRTTAHTKTA